MRHPPRLIGLALAVLLIGSAQASAHPRPGRTERVSIAGAGEANGESGRPDISADGRFVAFESGATNLAPGDTNEQIDIFVFDRQEGSTSLVTEAADGTPADSVSRFPSVSDDGRFVSFVSVASNLVPGVAGQHVYVKDLETGAIELASRSTSGAAGNADSLFSTLSADGRYVVYDSIAGNLVPGDTNNSFDVFVFDRLERRTERLSVSSTGGQLTGLSGGGVISADGRFAAFYSYASNVVPSDLNNTQDIFVRDRQAGTTERVSLASDDAEANSLSYAPSISDDGRIVAFQSLASNLVPNDFNGSADAFVRDRVAGTTERVSLTSDGAEASAFLDTSLSADGRYVLFQSADPRLISGGIPGALNMVVHDRLTGVSEVASRTDAGEAQDNWSGFGEISAGGRFVAFDSNSTNLVAGDAAGSTDVFVRDGGPALGVGTLNISEDANGVSVSGWATFSGGPVSAAADPAADAVPGSAAVGAELTEAIVAFRPERGDLLVRLDVNDLPGFREPAAACAATLGACVGSAGGAPGVLYGLRLTVGSTPYEIRIVRRQGVSLPSPAGVFALYRCDVSPCVQVDDLPGGYGTAGNVLLTSVPLSALGASEGTALSAVRAFAALGEDAVGEGLALDEVTLPNLVLPARRVEVGVAPVGTPESGVVFEAAALGGGTFTADLVTVPPGSAVWARACLGASCGGSLAVELGPRP